MMFVPKANDDECKQYEKVIQNNYLFPKSRSQFKKEICMNASYGPHLNISHAERLLRAQKYGLLEKYAIDKQK